MNGEMYQLAKITSYVNNTVKSGTLLPFKNGQYESDTVFVCANKKSFSDAENETITGTTEWVKALLQRKVTRAVCYVNTFDDPVSAGFANAGHRGLVTVFEDGQSLWIPEWEFDRSRTIWNVTYREKLLDDAGEPPKYHDNTEEFKDVLEAIAVFAKEIGCKHWASVFLGAREFLTGMEDFTIPDWIRADFPNFDERSARIFLAASKADVFGGMGSWNDDPSGMADEKHRSDDYQKLSEALFKQTRSAVLYAVNRG